MAGKLAFAGDLKSGGTLHALDVGRPQMPTLVGSVSLMGTFGSIAASPDARDVYGIARPHALWRVDASQPSRMAASLLERTPAEAFELVVSGGLLYLADGTGGLRIYDLPGDPTPTAPSLEPQVWLPVALRSTVLERGR
jgi:hypothetical protein